MAGKQTTRGRVNTIVGLDPAGPLFSVDSPADRLASGDADYVEGFKISFSIGSIQFGFNFLSNSH